MGNVAAWFAHHYPNSQQHKWRREEEESSRQHERETVSAKQLEEETNHTYVESMTTRRTTTTTAGMRLKRKRDNIDNDDDDDRGIKIKTRKCCNKRKEQSCTNVNDMASTVNSQLTKENSITAEDVETMKCTCYTPSSATITSDQETTSAVFFTSQDDKAVTEGNTQIENKTTFKEEPLCRCVCFGDTVEQTYGCHYHLYKTTSPAESHGVALGWSLRRQPLRLHSLLTLGRVANSCRKKVVLVGNSHDTVVLQYAAEL